MKKLFLLLVIAAGAFALSSCAKAYTCTETTTVGNNTPTLNIKDYDALTAKEKTDIENLGTYSYTESYQGVSYLVTVVTECK